MSKVDRLNSALHDSDNAYHIYCNCRQEDNIKKRCSRGDAQPDNRCEWCNEIQARRCPES